MKVAMKLAKLVFSRDECVCVFEKFSAAHGVRADPRGPQGLSEADHAAAEVVIEVEGVEVRRLAAHGDGVAASVVVLQTAGCGLHSRKLNVHLVVVGEGGGARAEAGVRQRGQRLGGVWPGAGP